MDYYPDAICMICGNECMIIEEVDCGINDFELWCYCEDCEIDTFHPKIIIPTKEI